VAPFPVTNGNALEVYAKASPCWSHAECHPFGTTPRTLETFIFQADETGHLVRDALVSAPARDLRFELLYDAMDASVAASNASTLAAAGGKYSVFLPLNPLRRRVQVNMRNHRKVLVVDAGSASPAHERRRRIPGKKSAVWVLARYASADRRPGGCGLAAIFFLEDWDFAAAEDLRGRCYFRERLFARTRAQIIDSGPDREFKAIREIYFAAIL